MIQKGIMGVRQGTRTDHTRTGHEKPVQLNCRFVLLFVFIYVVDFSWFLHEFSKNRLPKALVILREQMVASQGFSCIFLRNEELFRTPESSKSS